jgi:DNA invertase Pin-like site-specific DNA recombinase
MGRHIAVYVRVSTKQQRAESQLPDLRRWVANYAGDQPVVWYEDQSTGTKMDRPHWNRLQTAIEQRQVSTLVVWRLDRLGRTVGGLNKLFKELPIYKVNLVSLKDSLDLSTAAGRLMANVLASVAEYETELRGERVLAGQAAAKAKGKTWGGGEKLRGRRAKVTDDQLKVVLRMYKEKESVMAIHRVTQLSRVTIYEHLAAAGLYEYKRQPVSNATPK